HPAQDGARRLQHRRREEGPRRRRHGALRGDLRTRQPRRAAQQGMGGSGREGALAQGSAALHLQPQPRRAAGAVNRHPPPTVAAASKRQTIPLDRAVVVGAACNWGWYTLLLLLTGICRSVV